MIQNKQKTKTNFFGLPDIGIPSEVLFHPELTNTEKMLFGYLRNLSQTEKGCWASNKWLGGLLGVGGQTITNGIKKLKEWKYILVEYEQTADGRNVRRVFINPEYSSIYRELVQEGYKNINEPILKKLYPSIKKLMQGYKKTYNKDDIESEIKDEIKKKKKNSIFLQLKEYFPEEWKKDRSFKKALKDFTLHRKEKHQPITSKAGKALANKLCKYSMQQATSALIQSIENGWTGVFPASESKKTMKGSNNSSGTRRFIPNTNPHKYAEADKKRKQREDALYED